jgi:hypothetical protein
MGPGDKYPDELRAALGSADVLLAIIGPDWLTMAEDGQRLIDRRFDWVRYEIATAFQQEIPVLPVLLRDTPASAGRITKDDLPADISELALRQAFEFSQRRFGTALDELVARIVELVPSLVDDLDVPTPPNATSAATTAMRDVHIAGNGVIGINNGDMR